MIKKELFICKQKLTLLIGICFFAFVLNFLHFFYFLL